jgi:L-malate glycosyltransferase
MTYNHLPMKMQKPIKCLQVIDSLGTGGAQKMVVTLARLLAKKKIPITVISLGDDPDTVNAHKITSLGGKVVNFPASVLFNLNRINKLVDYVRDEEFNIIHSYLIYANIISALAGKITGIPVIASLRSVRPDPLYYHPIRNFIETLCLRYLVQRVMVNGHAIAQNNKHRLGGRYIDVIPNAIEISSELPDKEKKFVRKELAGDASRPIIISCGRLVPVKGFSDLIESIDLIRKKVPRIFLAIAGDGISHKELENQIANSGLTNHVKLLGHRHDVSRLLSASDIYVNSSHLEGMPVSILEAMAAGLPIVATDVGDNARVVLDGMGLVIPPHQPIALANALISLLTEPKKRVAMGSAARIHVKHNYSTDVWVKRILDLYEETITEKY